MKIVADCHLHIYPFYRIGNVLRSCSRKLSQNIAQGEDGKRMGFLAERSDCHLFRDLATGKNPGDGTYSVAATSEVGAIVLNFDGESPLYLFAGRQIVTEEQLEVLALTIVEDLPDGRPTADTIESVRDSGGVPVLPWGIGKWLFKRGTIVSRIIRNAKTGALLIGDTSLRPSVWPEPGPMRMARERDLAVVSGSDPLPVPGEEFIAGSYCSKFEGEFDELKPVSSIRSILSDPEITIQPGGKRCGFLKMVQRLYRYYTYTHRA
jgi:hypothetical protein